MKNLVYFDYNATAPLKDEVIDFMSEILRESGNASSLHSFGRNARKHVEKAREQVAELAHTHSNSVTFTSGATEANNTVLGAFKGQRILVSAIEHPSILDVIENVETIPVTPDGIIDLVQFEEIISKGDAPALISVMLVNNETGVIQPVEQMARIAKKKHPQVFIHTDASQAPGRIKIDMPALQVDYMSLCAHKFGGPQGTGALLSLPGAKPARLLLGGGQEKRQRAGTENVAAIAGMGLACTLATRDMDQFIALAKWRDQIENAVTTAYPDVKIFGQNSDRVANTSSICTPGLDAQTQLMAMDLEGIALSNGSACSSGKVNNSYVLRAMGASDSEAGSAVRLSIGWETKQSDIDHFIKAWSDMISRTAKTSA